ncbi:hypothetical protein EYZ11_010705 [Aspergillus tanneri]|uniref:Uncharacterized protein n=1 Tax=Aspergillus tanneri TaxID=1220188 RepID=A0A4S3J6T7_9EURO|nr:hypothetical protein EYZ11_010705 [Aspergillus tanneri]
MARGLQAPCVFLVFFSFSAMLHYNSARMIFVSSCRVVHSMMRATTVSISARLLLAWIINRTRSCPRGTAGKWIALTQYWCCCRCSANALALSTRVMSAMTGDCSGREDHVVSVGRDKISLRRARCQVGSLVNRW